MGRFDSGDGWLPDDGRDRDRAIRKAARTALATANPPECPIEEPRPGERDLVHKAARQLLALSGHKSETRQTLATLAVGFQATRRPEAASGPGAPSSSSRAPSMTRWKRSTAERTTTTTSGRLPPGGVRRHPEQVEA